MEITDFECRICFGVMWSGVIASDGYTYHESCLCKYLKTANPRSLITMAPLSNFFRKNELWSDIVKCVLEVSDVLDDEISDEFLLETYDMIHSKKVGELVRRRKVRIPSMDEYVVYFVGLVEGGDCEKVMKFIDGGKTFNYNYCGYAGYTPIHVLCMWGMENVLLKLKDCIDWSVRDCDGNNVLHLACLNGMVRFIGGVEINMVDDCVNVANYDGDFPYMIALEKGMMNVLHKLIPDCCLNDVDSNGDTVLHIACRRGIKDLIVGLAGRSGINLDVVNKYGLTPLRVGMLVGLREYALCMLIPSITLNDVDDSGNTVLHIACGRGMNILIDMMLRNPLINRGIVNREFMTPFEIALREGIEEDLLCRLMPESIIGVPDGGGNNVLHLACRNGVGRVVDELLKFGLIDVDDENDKGETPFIIAVCRGNEDVALKVLPRELDVGRKYGGKTCYHIVCESGMERVAIVLAMSMLGGGSSLERGGRGFVKIAYDYNVYVLLNIASAYKMETLTSLIIAKLRTVTINSFIDVCKNGMDSCALNMVDILDLKSADEYGSTALHVVCKYGNMRSMMRILDVGVGVGVNVNACDINGDTPLHVAVQNGLLEVVRVLIDKGADVNIRNTFLNTPLMKACKNRASEVALELIGNDRVDVNIINKFGETPLITACSEKLGEVCLGLLRRENVNYTHIDNGNNTAYDFARANNMNDVMNEMRKLDKRNNSIAFRKTLLGGLLTFVGL